MFFHPYDSQCEYPMNISFNNQTITLSEGTTLADLIAQKSLEIPFAVALNTVFIPKNNYAVTTLREGDCVDIVRPVAGG